MVRVWRSALLHLCQYVFPHVKPRWQPPNHSHLLLRVSGMHCRIICRPSQLFLFSEELSNIIYSCLLTLTVVQNLVWSNQLNVSHFVIQCQLLPSHSLQIPCRPSKRVPSERLRLVKRFISHKLHTGAWGIFVLFQFNSIQFRYLHAPTYKLSRWRARRTQKTWSPGGGLQEKKWVFNLILKLFSERPGSRRCTGSAFQAADDAK